MTTVVAPRFVEVEGKLYLGEREWPEAIQVERVAIKTFDPRRTAWDGQNWKLWLENGNAVYTLAPDDEGRGDVLTLHRKVGSAVGKVPGHDTPEPAAPTPALTAAAVEAAPERPRIVLPSTVADGIVSGATSGYALQQLILEAERGRVQPLNPMARAILATRDPRQAAGSFKSDPWREAATGPLKLDPVHYGVNTANTTSPGSLGSLYGIPVYESRYHQDSSVPDMPTTPEMVRREFDQAQRRLRAELEAKLAAMQMAAVYPPVVTIPPGQSPPLAVSTEQSAQKWRAFLVDVGEFMRVLGQTADYLAENSAGANTELYFPDPMALRGRASQEADSWEREVIKLPVRGFHSQVSETAAGLRRRALTLSKLVEPMAASDEGDKIRAEVDRPILATVSEFEQDIRRSRWPSSETHLISAQEIKGHRRQAWEKWATENCEDCDSCDQAVEYVDLIRDLRPGQMLRTGDDGVLHHRLQTDVGLTMGDTLKLEYRIKEVGVWGQRGDVVERSPNVATDATDWTVGTTVDLTGHDHAAGNGEMGARDAD